MYHSSQSVASSNQVPLGDRTHSITPFLHRRKQVSGGQWTPRSLGCWPRLKSLLSQVLLLATGFDGQADFLVPNPGRFFTRNTWALRQWGLGFPWILWYQGSTWENLNFPLSWRRWCLCFFCVLGIVACWYTTVWPQCWDLHWVPVFFLTSRESDM